jgi:uncharacterized protein
MDSPFGDISQTARLAATRELTRAKLLAYVAVPIVLLAEITNAFFSPTWAVAVYVGSILALYASFMFARSEEDINNITLSLAALALIRVLSLSLPLAPIRIEYVLGLIALGMLAVVGLTLRRVSFERPTEKSMLRTVLLQIGALGLGFVAGTMMYAIEALGLAAKINVLPGVNAGLVNDPLPTLIGIAAVVLIGVCDELVFRYLLQRSLTPLVGWGALIFTPLIQVALLVGFAAPVPLIFAFLFGMGFAFLTRATGSVLGAALGHGLANLVAHVIAPAFGAAVLLPWALACTLLALALAGVYLYLNIRGQGGTVAFRMLFNQIRENVQNALARGTRVAGEPERAADATLEQPYA